MNQIKKSGHNIIKKFREDNLEKINERRKKKFTCECGTVVCHRHKARHEQSKRHINYMNAIQFNL
jgi:hypothetical protein